MTIVRPFETGLDAHALIELLTPLYGATPSVPIKGMSKEMFGGQSSSVSVTELEHSEAVKELHRESMRILGKLERTTHADPHASGFRPHITDQIAGSFGVGEEDVLTCVSLVRMEADMRETCHTWSLADLH